ncbi:hypothetical protein [Marinoscillum sp.]|uniref:hypothetical protein n=1 Tax=Marinoscillum sp. TaxID=2024838 RepID=UPI003BA9565B
MIKEILKLDRPKEEKIEILANILNRESAVNNEDLRIQYNRFHTYTILIASALFTLLVTENQYTDSFIGKCILATLAVSIICNLVSVKYEYSQGKRDAENISEILQYIDAREYDHALDLTKKYSITTFDYAHLYSNISDTSLTASIMAFVYLLFTNS